MRLETTKNNFGNPHMLFSNLTQTTILNILTDIIMMRMTYASSNQIYENVDTSMI